MTNVVSVGHEVDRQLAGEQICWRLTVKLTCTYYGETNVECPIQQWWRSKELDVSNLYVLQQTWADYCQLVSGINKQHNTKLSRITDTPL